MIGRRAREFGVAGRTVALRRTVAGVMEIHAADDVGLAAGLGIAHAHDRMVQITLVRLFGQGRLSECLTSNELTVSLDRFARRMDFAGSARQQARSLAGEARAMAEAYCAGVNHLRCWPPSLRLVGCPPEPYRVEDILITINVMSYVGLAQGQADMEKFIIQAVRGGVDVGRLKRLFAPHLDGLTEELVSLCRRTDVREGVLPATVRFAVPGAASNNWVVAGRRSASGFPMLSSDPHLDASRLPPVWYEFVGVLPDDYRIGVSLPGVPGMIMGRTRHVAASFTYGFMDQVDYFLEECRNGTCRRGDDWLPLVRRDEIIRRQGGRPLYLTVWESDRGVVETGDGPPDGLLLCRAYVAARRGAASSLEALAAVPKARSVQAVQACVRQISLSGNWLLADRQGNIAYQQSGLLPRRSHSGLYPLPAWEPDSAWRGIVAGERLKSILNPDSGVLVTANDEHNPPAVNLHMGPYRRERIEELLSQKEIFTVEDMKQIQADVLSVQARRFLEIWRPLLPATPAGRLLAEWDLRYNTQSRGATLFEETYRALLSEVFSRWFGAEAWRAVMETTLIHPFYFYYFDRALLEDTSWYEPEGREPLLRRVFSVVLGNRDPRHVPRWGTYRQLTMKNIFLGERLPRLSGVNRGPIPFPGGRATPAQANTMTAHGQTITFAPSWRFVTDMGSDEAHTALAGGPSERPYSPLYTSDLKRWLAGQYKVISAPHADHRSDAD